MKHKEGLLFCLVTSIFLIQLTSSYAKAQSIGWRCDRPTVPFCIDDYFAFENDISFQSCRSDLEYYLDAVGDYEDCLVRAVKIEISEVVSEAEKAIDRFNCKARGDLICY